MPSVSNLVDRQLSPMVTEGLKTIGEKMLLCLLLCVLPWQNIGEVAVKSEGLKEISGLKNLD